MDKETLKKANFLVRQAQATKSILKRMKDGETMAISGLNSANRMYEPLLFDERCDFIHDGVKKMLEQYQDYLKQEFEKL